MIHIIPGLFAFDFKTTTTTKKKTPREENKSISMYYCWKTYVTFILAMQKVFEQEHHEHESLIECLLGVWSVDIERFYLPFSNNRFILALLHIYNVIGLSTKEFLAIKKEVKRSKRSGSRKESREWKKKPTSKWTRSEITKERAIVLNAITFSWLQHWRIYE